MDSLVSIVIAVVVVVIVVSEAEHTLPAVSRYGKPRARRLRCLREVEGRIGAWRIEKELVKATRPPSQKIQVRARVVIGPRLEWG